MGRVLHLHCKGRGSNPRGSTMDFISNISTYNIENNIILYLYNAESYSCAEISLNLIFFNYTDNPVLQVADISNMRTNINIVFNYQTYCIDINVYSQSLYYILNLIPKYKIAKYIQKLNNLWPIKYKKIYNILLNNKKNIKDNSNLLYSINNIQFNNIYDT